MHAKSNAEHLCTSPTNKKLSYRKETAHQVHISFSARSVIVYIPKSRTVCGRNVQLMPTLFLKHTKIWQREYRKANSSISATALRFDDTHSLMTRRQLWSVATKELINIQRGCDGSPRCPHSSALCHICFQLVVVPLPICCIHSFEDDQDRKSSPVPT